MPSRKKRVEPPVHIKGVIIFLLLVIALCIYAFYFFPSISSRGKPDQITPPEMIDYFPSCRRMNQQIYRFCKDLGVMERDFNILEQRLVHREAKKWIYTRAEVFLPRGVDPAHTAKGIVEELKDFQDLSSRLNKKEENQVSLSIWLGEVLTYSLTVIRRLPRLAIIIDDIGGDLEITREFLDLGIPLTFSILPDLPYSRESEEMAHKRGYEVMLHLPMEPKNLSAHNPGEGAIYTDTDESEIFNTVIGHINKFKYIKGVNNHMGSRITENEQIVRWVLNALEPTGLYFIDSRTTSRSVACKIAREMEISSGKNEIFIDNEPEVNYCKNFIDKAFQQAKKEGKSIAIGHPRETTLQALREINSRAQDEGISLVFVSDLVL
jgi:hypothetical protein